MQNKALLSQQEIANQARIIKEVMNTKLPDRVMAAMKKINDIIRSLWPGDPARIELSRLSQSCQTWTDNFNDEAIRPLVNRINARIQGLQKEISARNPANALMHINLQLASDMKFLERLPMHHRWAVARITKQKFDDYVTEGKKAITSITKELETLEIDLGTKYKVAAYAIYSRMLAHLKCGNKSAATKELSSLILDSNHQMGLASHFGSIEKRKEALDQAGAHISALPDKTARNMQKGPRKHQSKASR